MFPGAERAVIDPAKVRDYLLSTVHPVGRFKAIVFQALGYTAEEWQRLRDARQRAAKIHHGVSEVIMHNVLDTVALTQDLPEVALRRGDVGAVVEVLGPDAYEVEFVAASGRTQALVTVAASQIRALGDRDLIAVRSLAEAEA